jgi:hypothetical protein
VVAAVNPAATNNPPVVDVAPPPASETPTVASASPNPFAALVTTDTNAPAVTPQMLVPFLVQRLGNTTTNGSGLSVVMPVGFAPPSSPPPPSSSATYLSPPAPSRP